MDGVGLELPGKGHLTYKDATISLVKISAFGVNVVSKPEKASIYWTYAGVSFCIPRPQSFTLEALETVS